jgi:hypothetical protein
MEVKMNKKASWTLPAILGVVGVGMFLDAIWLKALLPVSRLFEGILGIVFIVLAIAIHKN